MKRHWRSRHRRGRRPSRSWSVSLPCYPAASSSWPTTRRPNVGAVAAAVAAVEAAVAALPVAAVVGSPGVVLLLPEALAAAPEQAVVAAASAARLGQAVAARAVPPERAASVR